MNTNRWRLRLPRKTLAAGAVLLAVASGVSAAAGGTARADTPIFTGNCPAGSPTSAPGCGGVSDGTSTQPEPGFLADEPANPNDISTQQDGWTGGQGEQDMTVYSYHNWNVTATDGPSNTASILTYPETGFNYYDAANPARYNIRDLTSISSYYNETMPRGATNLKAEAAYDIWLNDWATEVMIWTDVNYVGVDCGGPDWTPQCSGANPIFTGNIGGQSWTLYSIGSGINGFYMWMPNNGQPKNLVSEPSGTIDVLSMLRQTAVSGGFTQAAPLTSIEYGWEIADTNNVPLNFQMNDFEVSINGDCCGQGGTGGGGGGGTAPAVTTNAASGVTSSGATLNGTVNPEGDATTYQFEYGTSTSYGSTAPASPGSAGSGTTAVNESAAVSGLSPSTTYHYRLDATNSTGTTDGGDQTFTTNAAGAVVAFDASAGAKNAGSSPLSWTQAVGSGSNRALLVDFTVGSSNDAGCTPHVTDNGTAMTELTAVHSDNQHAGALTVWGLLNPPSGTNTISASVSGCTSAPSALTGGSESFTGVSGFGSHAIAYGAGATSSVSLAAATGDLVGEFAADGSYINAANSPVVSKFIENQNSNTGAGNSAGGYEPGNGASQAGKWTMGASDWWGAAAVDLLHA